MFDLSKFHLSKLDISTLVRRVRTLVRRARVGASRSRVRYVGGVVTVAIAAMLVTGAIVTDEPAGADQPVAEAEAAIAAPTETEAPAAAEAPVEEVPVVEEPPPEAVAPEPPPAPVYEDNLDGWIREALDILAAHNIPASYDGIMRNIMRESTGNPQAINLWDSNAAAGIPSKGLLQVIDPTYAAYHVEGTVYDIWDPVSNIVAACNYAADKYGSIDNVYGPY